MHIIIFYANIHTPIYKGVITFHYRGYINMVWFIWILSSKM